jgi:hypothetical protein
MSPALIDPPKWATIWHFRALRRDFRHFASFQAI